MCRPSANGNGEEQTTSSSSTTNSNSGIIASITAAMDDSSSFSSSSVLSLFYTIYKSTTLRWLILVIIFPSLPSYCFINRGFTQWFHWLTIVELFTQNFMLCKFQLLSGIGICIGWYTALFWDYYSLYLS